MRKDISEYMKQIQKDGLKPVYSEVARMFNCDYRTVKGYYEHPEKEIQRAKKPSKLDSYKQIIDDKLDIKCSYYSIYKFIEKHGYTGKYSILADYCHNRKEEEIKKATIRFETNPGLQAQVDWKEEMTLHTRNGESVTFNIFLTLLGYSRKKYIELTLDRAQDTLMSAMVRSFEYFGGVPKEILFDNMKTVVDQSKTEYSKAVINERFYQFSKDIGFEVWACRPYRPQTKGKVEALARTMERLRPYDYEFDTIDELDEIIRDFLEDLNNEVSKATNQIPNVMAEKEKEYLHFLPAKETIDTYLTIPPKRKVSKESMVVYNKRKYSLPTNYIGKTVQIKEEKPYLYILFNGIIVATHEISKKTINYQKDHMVEILKSDAMKRRTDEEIEEVARRNLEIYDSLGG